MDLERMEPTESQGERPRCDLEDAMPPRTSDCGGLHLSEG